MTGIGSSIIARSVKMLKAALVNHIAFWLMHFAGSFCVQKARIGTHANMLPKTAQIVNMMTETMIIQLVIWNFFIVKMRWY